MSAFFSAPVLRQSRMAGAPDSTQPVTGSDTSASAGCDVPGDLVPRVVVPLTARLFAVPVNRPAPPQYPRAVAPPRTGLSVSAPCGGPARRPIDRRAGPPAPGAPAAGALHAGQPTWGRPLHPRKGRDAS